MFFPVFSGQGPLVISSVTGRLEPLESPAWKRRAFRYLVSFPIIGLCLALVFVVMVVILRLQVFMTKNSIYPFQHYSVLMKKKIENKIQTFCVRIDR